MGYAANVREAVRELLSLTLFHCSMVYVDVNVWLFDFSAWFRLCETTYVHISGIQVLRFCGVETVDGGRYLSRCTPMHKADHGLTHRRLNHNLKLSRRLNYLRLNRRLNLS